MEQSFNEREAIGWMQENWRKSFIFSVAYVVLIFGIQYLMKDRRGYKLRTPLALWSLGLALFSAIGAYRTWKHMISILTTMGFKQSVCNQVFYVDPVCKFWVYLFALSKVLELGDTVFIILRKQKLIFLHWYHHILTLIYTWYCYKEMMSGGGWFITLNLTIHTIMYSYYTVRAAGFRLSRWIAMAITVSQILQMAIGVTLCILLIWWRKDEDCLCTWPDISFSFLMYLSYLVLFCNFFSKSYLVNTQKLKGE
ncbi:elongation of very long chain fatty acids protein 3 [Coturnix japonica]|uniref:Elongation of very long chain fatty acids protein n=1 Tax=Coturnix japonica TaxID=93934 RepID=A0A8C2U6I1_COTJA|nr:elongation of very long chain fatty acids protein 3 [Coturnix japonica]